MYIWEKIQKAISKNLNKGDLVRYKEIINIVRKEYPKIKTNCIIPSDLCNIHKNKDPRSGKHKIFQRISLGKYRVL